MGAPAVIDDRQDKGLALLVAGLTAGAGLIHFSVVADHSGADAIVPVGFMVAGWAQVGLAVALLLRRRTTLVLAATIAVNVAALGVWAWSRTAGLPFDPYGGVPEPVGSLDLTAAILQAGAITLAVGMLVAPATLRLPTGAAVFGAVAAIAVASMVVVSPDGASPDTVAASGTSVAAASGDGHGAGGHHGGGATAMATGTATGSEDHAADMIRIDRARCDLAFNPQAYWDEALAFGVDTYDGGNMSMPAPSGFASVGRPTPLNGRGSQVVDELIGLTTVSSGEGAAARLILGIAEASDEDYQAWRNWVAANPGGHTSEAPTTTPGQAPVPTMGHPGPQVWRAMVDAEACDQLAEELALARETALRYPTTADATAAGWVRVTPYVPGIAAHYMNFGLVDGEFDIEQPEMLLFDGTDPDSRIVGLSYYVRLDGNAAPSQGFVGDNDLYHRHFGLCVGAGGVIGDSTTTDEECAARGGVKANGTDGWMSHAWVVPGCESPWGVFSGENPILDGDLGAATGDAGSEGCAASRARQRYDLDPGESDLLVRGGDDPSEEAAGS